MTHHIELSPDRSLRQQHLRQQIVDFWIELQRGDDSGGTTWEVLDNLSAKVTDCLMNDPPRLNDAMRFTSMAALLIEGRTVC